MAKKKQEAKLKEPVRIRFKQLANGNQSIYLDYYTGDVILWNVFITIEQPKLIRNIRV